MLCREIALGTRVQLIADDVIRNKKDVHALMNVHHDHDINDFHDVYVDDLSGKMLEPDLVKAAREEDANVQGTQCFHVRVGD